MFKWPWSKQGVIIPFIVVVTLRTSGKKRGIHYITKQHENVVKAWPSTLLPYMNFDLADGTRVSYHRDLLLRWRSHIPSGAGG